MHQHADKPTAHGADRLARRTSSVVRSRYFYSMLLEEPDMTVEQEFHLGNARRHVAEMHGFGTVCGLRVEETGCHEEVVLKQGVAVDCLGREIRVECDIKVDLHEAVRKAVEARDQRRERRETEVEERERDREREREWDRDRDREKDRDGHGWLPEPVEVFVALCYLEVPERPVQSIGGPETRCAPSCEMSRTRSGFSVEVRLNPPEVPEKLKDVIGDLLQCEHERLHEWLCDWITDPCWSCVPDPCGKDHQCVGLARVRVVPGGRVVDIDNCCIRPLVLPTVLIGELTRYAVDHIRRSR